MKSAQEWAKVKQNFNILGKSAKRDNKLLMKSGNNLAKVDNSGEYKTCSYQCHILLLNSVSQSSVHIRDLYLIIIMIIYPNSDEMATKT